MTDATNLTLRPQAEIVERMRRFSNPASFDDFMGFRREVLITAITRDSFRLFAGNDADPATLDAFAVTPPDPQQLLTDAVEYYHFALDKISDHRGISAGRSVEKLTEYAWLLRRDDVVEKMDNAPYPQYGAPKIREFAIGFGLVWPGDDGNSEDTTNMFRRMAEELPCEPNCRRGCGV